MIITNCILLYKKNQIIKVIQNHFHRIWSFRTTKQRKLTPWISPEAAFCPSLHQTKPNLKPILFLFSSRDLPTFSLKTLLTLFTNETNHSLLPQTAALFFLISPHQNVYPSTLKTTKKKSKRKSSPALFKTIPSPLFSSLFPFCLLNRMPFFLFYSPFCFLNEKANLQSWLASLPCKKNKETALPPMLALLFSFCPFLLTLQSPLYRGFFFLLQSSSVCRFPLLKGDPK